MFVESVLHRVGDGGDWRLIDKEMSIVIVSGILFDLPQISEAQFIPALSPALACIHITTNVFVHI